MSGGRDIESRLRRHLAAQADELPFLLDAEIVHRRLAEQGRGRWRLFALVPAALVVLAVVVGGALLASPGRTPSGGPVDYGPMAVVPSTDGDEALNTGVLRMTDRCVVLETAGGESELLVWPADRVRWDAPDGIGFTDLDGRQFTIPDGAAVTLAGGGDSTAESGISGEDWAASVDWVAAPDPSCPLDIRWYVNEVVMAGPVNVELPTGTFVSERPFDGVCLALTVRRPDDATPAAQWWDAGASGDCRTRTSDVVTTAADFSEPPAMNVSIPLMDGGTRDIRLRFTGVFEDEIRFARSGEHEASFKRTEAVDPTFAPVP